MFRPLSAIGYARSARDPFAVGERLTLFFSRRVQVGSIDIRFDPLDQSLLFKIELIVFELDVLDSQVWAKTHIQCIARAGGPAL
jgi:hypothetical protein